MNSKEYYLQLITSEYRDLPLFDAATGALVEPFVDRAALDLSLAPAFNLDAAVGAQLDAVGLWIGLTRDLRTPLVGVYFSWDDAAAIGWELGSWRSPFDDTTGLLRLPDDVYRRLLRARIAANYWDGTIPGAARVWSTAFVGTQTIVIQDNQDMTMTVGFVGSLISALDQALLTGGYLPLKPAGVRIVAYAVPVDTNPLFAWDTVGANLQLTDINGNPLTEADGDPLVVNSASATSESGLLGGWGSGSWSLELSPNL
jgi:Protein of unknown function (DUF2612)